MSLHICNNCEHIEKCTNAFKNSITCFNIDRNIKQEQQAKFDNIMLKEYIDIIKEF